MHVEMQHLKRGDIIRFRTPGVPDAQVDCEPYSSAREPGLLIALVKHLSTATGAPSHHRYPLQAPAERRFNVVYRARDNVKPPAPRGASTSKETT
jgi:hypothetical protein